MGKERFVIIGGGRVGGVLAYHLQTAGFGVTGIVETSEQRRRRLQTLFPQIPLSQNLPSEWIPACDCLLICVPDDAIPALVQQLQAHRTFWKHHILAHTSGVLPASILQPLKTAFVYLASVHPIFSFSTRPPSQHSLGGVYFDLEGDREAVAWFRSVITRLGGRCLTVTARQKKAIHLASVFYSNFLVGLVEGAQQILKQAGLSPPFHLEPFLPLVQATLENLSTLPPIEALTGPLKRGDVSTVRAHLEWLRQHLPSWFPVYTAICQALLPSLDLPPEKRHQLNRLFEKPWNGSDTP